MITTQRGKPGGRQGHTGTSHKHNPEATIRHRFADRNPRCGCTMKITGILVRDILDIIPIRIFETRHCIMKEPWKPEQKREVVSTHGLQITSESLQLEKFVKKTIHVMNGFCPKRSPQDLWSKKGEFTPIFDRIL